MGALIGLMLAVGAWLIWHSGSRRPPPRHRTGRTLSQRVEELLAQAGYAGISPGQMYALSAVSALVAFLLVAGISRAPAVGLAFGCFAAYAPWALIRMRHRQRTTELRSLWPDVVDNLASAVRAGMSLPEAISAISVRGPEQLRPPFQAFAEDYRATGRFGECLDRLKGALADPTSDRIVESMRVAREVGGTDLGRLLRTLSQFLREDARTRGELETRQGWTVNAARLGLAAPWIVLALLALRPETVAAYDSAAGVGILVVGAAVSLGAYRVMLRIARLPDEQRVLR